MVERFHALRVEEAAILFADVVEFQRGSLRHEASRINQPSSGRAGACTIPSPRIMSRNRFLRHPAAKLAECRTYPRRNSPKITCGGRLESTVILLLCFLHRS